MDFAALKHIGRFLIITAIQAVILNQIHFSGYITPYLYPIFILLLPFDTRGYVLLLAAFFSGLAVDMFSNSLGMHASATLLMAFLRPSVIRLITIKSDFEPGTEPRVSEMGTGWVLIYSAILISIHHLALFFIEVFRFQEFGDIVVRSLLSAAFSLVLIMLTHLLMGNPKKSSAFR